MLRAIWLTIQNEFRLLLKDPTALLMLLLAPVVIITVAGYSLGSVYGRHPEVFRLPVVDRDHRAVAGAIIDRLKREPSVQVEPLSNLDRAQELVSRQPRMPLAIEIPQGTSKAVEEGHQAAVRLFVDPVRRIEANALELQIAQLLTGVSAQARAVSQFQIALSSATFRLKLKDLRAALRQEQTKTRTLLEQVEAGLAASIRTQTEAKMTELQKQTASVIRDRESRAWAQVEEQLAGRQQILSKIRDYLVRLQSSREAVADWISKIESLAGSHKSEIPPPPALPEPLSVALIAELEKPIVPPQLDERLPIASWQPQIPTQIPKSSVLANADLVRQLDSFAAPPLPVVAGTVGFVERPATQGSAVLVNPFDQYVPGFGVTFLLIGMLMGISLTLFDEREWGTLKRLRVGGTPLAGVLVGKLSARFMVGTLQMIVLFAVGRILFDISLGQQPLMLLLPTAAISFAAAAFGLVIAAVARSHDSVMPLGTMTSMAMSAIGGCWWPLDFEPGWMRALAQWMPTTWTMQAYNDLMIRRLPPSAALGPFLATAGLGLIFLAAGILLTRALED